MSQYMTELGVDATVGMVFADLGAKATSMYQRHAARLGIVIGGPDVQAHLLDTSLQLGYTSNPVGEGRTDVQHNFRAGVEPDGFGLLAISTLEPAPESHQLLTQVAGFRGFEPNPDFVLRRDYGGGCIRVQLGTTGLWAAGRDTRSEPAGESVLDATHLLRGLEGADRERFEKVARGILRNIAAVEIAAQGRKPADIIATADKPIRTTGSTSA